MSKDSTKGRVARADIVEYITMLIVCRRVGGQKCLAYENTTFNSAENPKSRPKLNQRLKLLRVFRKLRILSMARVKKKVASGIGFSYRSTSVTHLLGKRLDHARRVAGHHVSLFVRSIQRQQIGSLSVSLNAGLPLSEVNVTPDMLRLDGLQCPCCQKF